MSLSVTRTIAIQCNALCCVGQNYHVYTSDRTSLHRFITWITHVTFDNYVSTACKKNIHPNQYKTELSFLCTFSKFAILW